MNTHRVRAIADAVLYEGYILYPYRASAIKNQQRFNFGTLYPQRDESGEPWLMHAECLIQGTSPVVELHARFLHLMNRDVIQFDPPLRGAPQGVDCPGRWVASLEVDGTHYQTWQEATERELVHRELSVQALSIEQRRCSFAFTTEASVEAIINKDGLCVGAVRRSQSPLVGRIDIHAAQLGDELFKLTVEIQNHSQSPLDGPAHADGRVDQVFASTHMILGCDGGKFVSLTDPPDDCVHAVAQCNNIGIWPVLAGQEGDRDLLLASPIILPDHPQVAPESDGDFFDSTEVDEMLALRVMTMTDAEKAEMRNVDARARQILERTESITPQHMMNLHGAVRGLQPLKSGSTDDV